jgi:enamine deaminase RidA (YjgF/YER057c/UK114 family)
MTDCLLAAPYTYSHIPCLNTYSHIPCLLLCFACIIYRVMDGCSDVIMEVFQKPVGYHARSAIGTSTLPLDMSVEIEAIVRIKPE